MDEALGELYFRFLSGLPAEERVPDRLMFNLEEAHWYYEDWMVKENRLNTMSFHVFVRKMLERFPGLAPAHTHREMMELYRRYHGETPRRGAIILSPDMEKVVLVTNFTNTSFGFPKGKMNQGESDVACAVREVWEEIGINISQYVDPNEHLDYPEDSDEQRLFIVLGVQENVEFRINTRNEIGRVEWVRLNDIPSKKSRSESRYPGMHFSKVHNFLRNLRRWITKKKQEQQTAEVQPEPAPEVLKWKLSEFKVNQLRLRVAMDFPHLVH